jgi:small-conductance mechanosensitive channel
VLESGSFARLLTVDGWIVLIYEFGPPLVRAILLGVGTWIAARLARSSFNFAARRADTHARVLIGRIINIVIIGLGVATILDTVGVPLTTFVTILGVAGLGISLAMQDVLKSFVAGTFLLFERPFRIGDEISVKDQRGIVENVGIRTTRLRNADNVQIIIPNAVVFAEVVANRTNEVKPEPAEPPAEPAADAADHEGPAKDGATPAAAAAAGSPAVPAAGSPAVPAAGPAAPPAPAPPTPASPTPR